MDWPVSTVEDHEDLEDHSEGQAMAFWIELVKPQGFLLIMMDLGRPNCRTHIN